MTVKEFLKDILNNIGNKYRISVVDLWGEHTCISSGVIEGAGIEDKLLQIKLEDNNKLERFTIDLITNIEKNGETYKVIYEDESYFVIDINY